MTTSRKLPPPVQAMPEQLPRPVNPEALKARCFDPDWEYTPANSTDLAAKFKRIASERKKAGKEQREAEAAKQPHIVAAIKKRA